jgi:hypothetical protein
VTRQFAFKGQTKGPMAARGAPPAASVSPSPAGARIAALSIPAMSPSSIPPERAEGPGRAKGHRPIAPAARPGVAGVTAARPQIRPIAARRPTSGPSESAPPAPQTAALPKTRPALPSSVAPAQEGEGPRAFEIGDDGLADAEAALEAMSSFRLAEVALERGDRAEALRLAEKAASGDPTQADYVTLVTWIRALAGGPLAVEEAIATLSEVLADEPSNERARFFRGKLLVRANRIAEGLADFHELLSVNPGHHQAASEVRLLEPRSPS